MSPQSTDDAGITVTALVTGATAGIGACFARQLAARGYDLVLVARDPQRLSAAAEELATTYRVRCETVVADLAERDGCREVETRLADPNRPVELLINNAGIGLKRSFRRNQVEQEQRQLDLNVTAVMRLCHAVLPGMIERGHGSVVNVSSVAGFGPVSPGYTYSASKSWVTAFSESVGADVAGSGVKLMALCPGFTRTEFHDRAGITDVAAPSPMWLDAEAVVAQGLADLRSGKRVSVPSYTYKVLAAAVRHLPRPVLAAAVGGNRLRHR